MDTRVGGSWTARMILGDGVEIGWHGSYLEVDAPITWSEMTFTQSGGHMPPENYAQAEEGWRSFFEDLANGLSD